MTNDAPNQQVIAICDDVGTVLDLGGVVGGAVALFLKHRRERLLDRMISDLESGKLSPLHLRNLEWAGGAVFRLAAAIRQGARQKNIQLLARYYFGSKRTKSDDYDGSVEDAAIIESLNDAELRVLAILQESSEQAGLSPNPRASAERDAAEVRSLKEVDLLGLFHSHEEFQDAAMSLQRWGLVRPVSAWGAAIFEPTPKLHSLLGRLDLDGLILE